MITLKEVEAFYWVVVLGGLEPAANRLHTTQSAISKRVQELEAALGMLLFDRSRRKGQVTPSGERLLVLAREMLNVRDRIMDLASGPEPSLRTLRVGVTELTAMTWLPNWIQRIRGSDPTITLEPVVDSSVDLIEKLKADDLDIAVVPDTFREPDFEIISLDSVEFAWMCSPGYLNGVAEIDLAELAKFTIVTQLHGSGLGLVINHWLDDNNVTIERTLNSSSLSAIAALTLSGVGISYLPRRIFDTFIASGHLNVIRSRPSLPKVAYVLLYKKARADDFLRFVTSLATETCNFSRSFPAYLGNR